MKRRMTRIEERLVEWAQIIDDERKGLPLHDPSRPSESIEYRIMTGQTSKPGKGAVKTDGGMFQAYRKQRHNIAIAQRVSEINRILVRMRHTKSGHYEIITQAFLDRPGHICITRIGATEQNVSQNKYLRLYGEAVAFIEGALDQGLSKSA